MRLFERENYLEKIRGFCHDGGVVKVLAGVRRCGKSCLMQAVAEEISVEGIAEDCIICLDLGRQGARQARDARRYLQILEDAVGASCAGT